MDVSECVLHHHQQRQRWAELTARLGLSANDLANDRQLLHSYINLKLMALGLRPIEEIDMALMTPTSRITQQKATVTDVVEDLVTALRTQMELVKDQLPPVDARIQEVLNRTFPESMLPAGCPLRIRLPSQQETFAIDRANVAFELATPYNANTYKASVGDTNTKIPQGLICNPKSDKRSTVGTFHVVEGGAKISYDKYAVPQKVFAYMLAQALNPAEDLKQLPFTSTQPRSNQAHCWTSVYLTPPVIPGLAPGKDQPHIQKNMEVRYFAPASLVQNLGFVEQIFCNKGNPIQNDMLRVEADRFCGVTCLVILAPQLTKLTKKEVGLPHYDEATERQRRDGMCWKDEKELYNNGIAFKLTYRSPEDGVVFTIIADTYFGYSKKEIKTMISYASNIVGFSQEEHSGGCFATPVYSWGRSFRANDARVGLYQEDRPRVSSHMDLLALEQLQKNPQAQLPTIQRVTHTFEDMKRLIGPFATYDSTRGVLIDKEFKNIYYVPETVSIELSERSLFYKHPETGADMSLKVSRSAVYVLPNGYQIQLVRHPVSKQWMLIGTVQNPKFLFKPASVSGAGKSELSKSVMDAVTSGPFFIKDWARTFKEADEIINHDFGDRMKRQVDYKALGRPSRPLLSFERSLGSIIQLLTVDEELYTEQYNNWLRGFDQDSISFVFLVKAMYRPLWGDHNSWKHMFHIDKVNGKDGYSLKCQDMDVVCNYLRVGQEQSKDGWYWRNFRLRQDFYAAAKFQNNDDIGCSLVCAGKHLQKMSKNQGFRTDRSYKLTTNCEYRYFQRPDDACYPGIDKKCEEDLGRLEGKTFISNFEPVTREFCAALSEDVMTLEKYSKPMQNVIRRFGSGDFPQYDSVVVSSEFRIINRETGARSKNVRYLQTRDELLYNETKQDKYLMEMRLRLLKRIPFNDTVILPVNCYVPGRRLNTVDPKNPNIRPLSIYGPIHWQPVPLLMLEWITCLSGKSPSTSGSGSLEGCLSKGPFNNMLMSIDLNYACLALILGTEPVLSTAAGSVGHKLKVDHDITLILPELICRMSDEELDPNYLIKEGSLELVDNMVVDGQKVHSSILGYRITQKFVKKYFARIFDHVEGLFTDEMLRPEKQSMDNFVNGVDFIYTNMKQQVEQYCKDGSYEELIPPLQTLFDIVRNGGEHNGMTLTSPEFLKLFERSEVIKADWYKARLVQGQRNEIRTCERAIREMKARNLATNEVEERLNYVRSQQYLNDIDGSLGGHVFADEE